MKKTDKKLWVCADKCNSSTVQYTAVQPSGQIISGKLSAGAKAIQCLEMGSYVKLDNTGSKLAKVRLISETILEVKAGLPTQQFAGVPLLVTLKGKAGEWEDNEPNICLVDKTSGAVLYSTTPNKKNKEKRLTVKWEHRKKKLQSGTSALLEITVPDLAVPPGMQSVTLTVKIKSTCGQEVSGDYTYVLPATRPSGRGRFTPGN